MEQRIDITAVQTFPARSSIAELVPSPKVAVRFGSWFAITPSTQVPLVP